MKEVIQEKLQEIEKTHNIKVLFAVESGSRAWGFPSKDSDYDVRFVYIKHPNWYLSIDDRRDVIELPINDKLDINGWDIRKALKLFRKSNPPLMEWITSDMIYHDAFGFRDELQKLKQQVFSPKTCLHHYLSMAKGHIKDYFQGEVVQIKKYFYVLRPLLACMWIEKYNNNPPMLFQTLVDDLISEHQLKHEIENLLSRKISGEELHLEKRINIIDEFIDEQIHHFNEITQSIPTNTTDITETLDHLFRRYLELTWNF